MTFIIGYAVVLVDINIQILPSLKAELLGRVVQNPGRNPFNQNFRAEVRKFLGVEWIATGPKRSRSIPLAKRVSR